VVVHAAVTYRGARIDFFRPPDGATLIGYCLVDQQSISKGSPLMPWVLRKKPTGIKPVKPVQPIKPIKPIQPIKPIRPVKPIAPVGYEYVWRD
jgi:hypothetical protein